VALHSIVTIPSLTGGWVEIHCGAPSLVLGLWRENGFDPEGTLGHPIGETDLVGQFAIHAPASSFAAPIAWERHTQRRFAHFFAGLATMMTHHVSHYARFDDQRGHLSIKAEVYCEPSDKQRGCHVRLRVRAGRVLNGGGGCDLVLLQRNLHIIVESCCVSLPGLTDEDFRSAWGR
jgi:hypothetical protein